MLACAGEQHGLITRAQLLDLGVAPEAIRHRLRTGRLHLVRKGIYAVGSPRIGRLGRWMAAVLTCGPGAAASHGTAGAIFEICGAPRAIHVSVPADRRPRQHGVIVHRRARLDPALEVTTHRGIPVTGIVLTLIDMASTSERTEIETAINEADKLDLVDPEALRDSLARYEGWAGSKRRADVLDRATFTLTDSELERLFVPIARRAGLDRPLAGEWVNGFKVDFYWPELKLIVETDGLRYHRTPAQQTQDRRRDQVHAAAGLTTLRFTHAQVAYEPTYVEETLRAVAARLQKLVGWRTV